MSSKLFYCVAFLILLSVSISEEQESKDHQKNRRFGLNTSPYPSSRAFLRSVFQAFSLEYGQFYTKNLEIGGGLGYGLEKDAALLMQLNVTARPENLHHLFYFGYANFHLIPQISWLDVYLGSRIGGSQRFSPKGYAPTNKHFFHIEGNIGSSIYIWQNLGLNFEYGISNRFKTFDNTKDGLTAWRLGVKIKL